MKKENALMVAGGVALGAALVMVVRKFFYYLSDEEIATIERMRANKAQEEATERAGFKSSKNAQGFSG